VSIDSASPPEQLGARLRAARIEAGLSISDLAALTHVRSVYLIALEEGDYDQLPEDVYSRNFVRLFALHVGLPVEPTLLRYQRERHEALGTDTAEQRLEQDRATATSLRRTPVTAPAIQAPRRAIKAFVPPRLQPWILGGVLAVALLTLASWGLQSLFNSGAASELDAAGTTNPSPASTPTGAPTGDLPPREAAPVAGDTESPPGVAAVDVEVVLVDVLSTPEGATVTIDGFVLPGVTPLTGVPLRPRSDRVVAVELAGYQGLQTTVDLLEDRRLAFTLAPLAAAAGAPTTSAQEILFTITETSWFEVWQSGNRNQGERLAYTTAAAGAEYRFDLPVYVHVGNAGGVRVNLGGQDLGPLGGPGAVLGRAFGD
jgi:cytoskeleton protein RodZ